MDPGHTKSITSAGLREKRPWVVRGIGLSVSSKLGAVISLVWVHRRAAPHQAPNRWIGNLGSISNLKIPEAARLELIRLIEYASPLSESEPATAMEIAKILTVDRIRVPLNGPDKTSVITELVDVLNSVAVLNNRDAALQSVLKREAERSTGIGFGLAIPHGKSDGAKSLVMAAGKPREPIDFQSADGRPVHFIVLLVSPPDQTGAHIQALAKISRLMNGESFRSAISRAQSADELYSTIATFEAGLA